ncbi:YbbR-like domain-containing protein [uncultured Kriegella sp.]|uniref:CdaR family protein n=1 Tax=uncultured Kriegella sp. TaxID=1798910 RepID=UPI0030DBE26A
MIWFINNLSESYVNYATFDLEYINAPDSLRLADISKENVNVKLEAVGFQFLGFNLKNKTVVIDLSDVENEDSKFFIPHAVFRKQIESQLPSSMSLLEMDKDTLSFDFYRTENKKVKVKPRLRINLAQNYLLDGELLIEPDSIIITGPKDEIDSITEVRTIKQNLSDLTADFSKTLEVYRSPELKKTVFSTKTVQVSGAVARFSEKILEVPIKVVNEPKGMKVKIFPDKVSVVCKAKIDELKQLESSDFQVTADYGAVNKSDLNMLDLILAKKPKSIHSARLNENKVEFILTQKQ